MAGNKQFFYNTMEVLDETFPSRWIGRGGQIACGDQITTAIASTEHCMFHRLETELEYRSDIVRVTRGAHVKVD
ncbi:hypothetical protein PR048_006014 [Dryococelus australis]|uniref:Uncharacterized protein n=1 Tax=Dryococelus australis TaxID=614101 RepID=A0ABQ9IBZ3_9NEOP|nr:hypothetical protein PR048_006014 [Dryococelus australis]